MPKQLRPAREKGVIAAIDIGGSKVACVIAEFRHHTDGSVEPELIGVGQQGLSSRNIDGNIENAVGASVELAEKMAGERIKSAYVLAGGRSIGCRLLGVELDLIGGCVTSEDVQDVLTEAAKQAAPEGSAALHSLPVQFKIDGEPVLGEPTGLFGDLLSAEVLGVSVRNSYASNVEALLERCGLGLDGLFASAVSTAQGVLIDDEKELGVILIDIGAKSSDFAIYERGSLVECGGIGLGGGHVTRDIAQIFGAPIADAERIKTLHGSAIEGRGDANGFIDFPQLGEEREIARVPKNELTEVIAPRLEEIFELTLAATKRHASIRRVVVTGGGSLLVGTREIAEKVIGAKTRMGRPASLGGAPDVATSPQFASAIGAVRLAANMAAETRPLGRRLFQARQNVGERGTLLSAAGAWLRQNF